MGYGTKRGGIFLFFFFLSAGLRSEEPPFQYQQFETYFSTKVIPSANTARVTLQKISRVTHRCVTGLVENVVRSIYERPEGQLVIDKDHDNFSLSENGASYGGFFFSGLARFLAEREHHLIFWLSQKSVLRKNIVANRETGERADFFWNGPFGLHISEVTAERQIVRSYAFRLDSLAHYLRDEGDGDLMDWGYGMGLPILHATLVDKNQRSPDARFAGMSPEKEFTELNLFYPFYFRQKDGRDLAYLSIDGVTTDIAFSRRDYAECLKNGIQAP